MIGEERRSVKRNAVRLRREFPVASLQCWTESRAVVPCAVASPGARAAPGAVAPPTTPTLELSALRQVTTSREHGSYDPCTGSVQVPFRAAGFGGGSSPERLPLTGVDKRDALPISRRERIRINGLRR